MKLDVHRIICCFAGLRNRTDDLSQNVRSDSAIIARGHMHQVEPERLKSLKSPIFQRQFFWNKGLVQPADRTSQEEQLARRHSAGMPLSSIPFG